MAGNVRYAPEADVCRDHASEETKVKKTEALRTGPLHHLKTRLVVTVFRPEAQ